MKFIKIFLKGIISILLFIPLSGNTQSIIKGSVTDKKGKPVPYANAYLKRSITGASTDDAGQFKIVFSGTGRDTLQVTCIGYLDFYLPVILDNKEIPLSITLKEAELALGEFVISAGTIEANNERSVAVLRPLDIVTTAGGQGDIAGAIQTLPGVQRNGGDQTGLMVRGGDVNESVVIIDGTVAQNAFMSAVPGVSQRTRFNPFQFKGTSFSSGGYTARYGQALSAILDLQTNDLPEKNNINIGINMSGVSVSGGKLIDNNAVEFSGSYINLSPFYNITPTNVKFFKVPQGGSFSTRWVSKLNDDKGIFKMNFSHSANKTGITIPNPFAAGSQVNFFLGNDNTFFNTSLKYWITSKLKYFSAFSFSSNNDNITIDKADLYRSDSRLQGRAEAWYEFSGQLNLLSGFELQKISYSQKYDTLLGKFDEMLSAVYFEGEYKPSRWFGIKPGVRAEYSQLIAKGNIVPRLAFAFKTGNHSQISFAGGMFYQTAGTQYLLQGYRPDFQKALHYMLNYQVMKDDRTLRVEAYYKSYQQLIREKGVAYNPNLYRFNFGQLDNSGNGYAQGLDIFWRDKRSIRNFDYWISYSYIDTKRIYQNYVSKATPDYVSTHNLNLIAKYFFERIQTNFSASYNYASGRPYYNPASAVFLADHAPDYHNFAMTASYLTTIKKMFAVIYISADNIFNNKNILGYRYSGTSNQASAIIPPLYRSVFIGINLSLTKFKQDEL